MSNRTLIEINHDYAPEIATDEFRAALRQYIRSADRESAGALERFGVRVISMRHHADKFYVKAGTDGFPVKEYTEARP